MMKRILLLAAALLNLTALLAQPAPLPKQVVHVQRSNATVVFGGPTQPQGRSYNNAPSFFIYPDKRLDEAGAEALVRSLGMQAVLDENFGMAYVLNPVGENYAADADFDAFVELFNRARSGNLKIIAFGDGATFVNQVIALRAADHIAGIATVGGKPAKLPKGFTSWGVPAFVSGKNAAKVAKEYEALNAAQATFEPLLQVVVSTVSEPGAVFAEAWDKVFSRNFRFNNYKHTHYEGARFGEYGPYELEPYAEWEPLGIERIVVEYGASYRGRDLNGPKYLWYEYWPKELLEGAPAHSVPVVVLLHGNTNDPRTQAETSGFLQVAGEERFFLVEMEWQGTPNYQALGHDGIESVLALLFEKYPQLDPSRVYAHGLSAGSMTATALGIKKSHVFAAVGGNSGALFTGHWIGPFPTFETIWAEATQKRGNVETAYISVFGTKDTTVPYMTPDNWKGNSYLNAWNAYEQMNGMDVVSEMDFENHPLFGQELRDRETIRTHKGEGIVMETGQLYKGDKPLIKLVAVMDYGHWNFIPAARVAWDFFKHYRRDPNTKKLLYGPTPEERARQLISKMTLQEKTALMRHDAGGVERLGILPYNWWNEALHGVARNGKATTFPQPIGMAAAFDEALLEEVFTAASDEARVKHRQGMADGESGWYEGLTFWTPNINIFRDPRWGRGMETYGEDPYLTGQLGMAVVRGLQGDPDAPVLKAHACAKHFAVHSGPEWNRHSFDAVVSDRDLRETYLPAFKDLVTKANVQEVMIAYNRLRSVPCGANTFLIDTVLRGEWQFKGLVVSDCWAIHDFFMPGRHGYCPDVEHAVSEAVRAGTDLNCGESYRHIPETVTAGLLDEAELEPALTRILAARIRLGELDAVETPWDKLGDDIVEGADHRALARRIARESIVLLQNRDAILPLKGGARIALVGPNADDKEMLWGNYNAIPEHSVTLAEALRTRIPNLTVLPGCELVSAEPLSAAAVTDVLKQLEGIDIVVFAGGISPRVEGEEMPVELPGFRGGDRTDIELPAVQRQLLATLHKAGKKVVLVNFSGSAMGLVPETESCDAIVQAWYPGQEGGTALAEVLLGDVVPSGKLPVTFYRTIEQVPDYENYDMKGRTYRYFDGEPLFPFGYGLSYTTFAYGKACVNGDVFEIPVTNTGSRDGDEVVQFYVRRPADTEGPLKSLRGFQRVRIPAGATVTVRFPLNGETFLSWSPEAGDMVPMKGAWELLYGGSSADKDLQRIAYTF